jgi:hypothetical protein
MFCYYPLKRGDSTNAGDLFDPRRFLCLNQKRITQSTKRISKGEKKEYKVIRVEVFTLLG